MERLKNIMFTIIIAGMVVWTLTFVDGFYETAPNREAAYAELVDAYVEIGEKLGIDKERMQSFVTEDAFKQGIEEETLVEELTKLLEESDSLQYYAEEEKLQVQEAMIDLYENQYTFYKGTGTNKMILQIRWVAVVVIGICGAILYVMKQKVKKR